MLTLEFLAVQTPRVQLPCDPEGELNGGHTREPEGGNWQGSTLEDSWPGTENTLRRTQASAVVFWEEREPSPAQDSIPGLRSNWVIWVPSHAYLIHLGCLKVILHHLLVFPTA